MRPPAENEKAFAAGLMTTLLDDILPQPANNNNYDSPLIQAHAVLPYDDELQSKLLQWFTLRLDSSDDRVGLTTHTFVYVLDRLVSKDMHPSFWEKWCKRHKKDNVQALVRHYVEQGSGYYDSERYYELMRESLSAQDIVNVLYSYAPIVFNAEKVMADYKGYASSRSKTEDETRKEKERHLLSNIEQFFARARNLVNAEVRENESFKQLVAATSMAYLWHASRSLDANYKERNGLFVNLWAEPLPLLRSMYPEHATALNTLRKEIIGSKTKYHGALYSLLARALYTDTAANPDVVDGLTQTMGVSVFSYFQACTMQQDVHFEVSSDLFEP